MTNLPGGPINVNTPPKLVHALMLRKLAKNREKYSEIADLRDAHLLPQHLATAQHIRRALLKVPLIHASTHQFSGDIVPRIYLPPQHAGNTYGFDSSLDLDQYVFLRWGLPSLHYGAYLYLVDSCLLQNPEVIVTPEDIADAGQTGNASYYEMDYYERQVFDERYFDTMVSGGDWLDIITYRLLKEVEFDTDVTKHRYPLKLLGDLGEIKHFGLVKQQHITEVISIDDHNNPNPTELQPYYKRLAADRFHYL